MCADAEQSSQRFELVGQRDSSSDGTLRDRVASEARPIVLGDRVGHGNSLAVVQRIVTPHDDLQLGKFADHFGHEVRLGEQSGAIGCDRIGTDFGGDSAREFA